jgi:hypothetical protein
VSLVTNKVNSKKFVDHMVILPLKIPCFLKLGGSNSWLDVEIWQYFTTKKKCH